MTSLKVTWSKDKADAALAPYREAMRTAGDWVLQRATPKWRLTVDDLAAVLLHASRVPGMCPDEKILALCSVAPECQPGDVVEIGTWWGKSALVLLLLARRYGIGNVLCVDPWKDAELVQGVPHVDEASAALSADEAFEVFKMSLLPYKNYGYETSGDLNYIRLRSETARQHFIDFVSAESPEFGFTSYRGPGKIALLHVDGNHAYEKVKQDLELWAPLVAQGGWVVIDDYDWRHGDGPRRAADELIATMPNARHFVAGGAMFVQAGGTNDRV